MDESEKKDQHTDKTLVSLLSSCSSLSLSCCFVQSHGDNVSIRDEQDSHNGRQDALEEHGGEDRKILITIQGRAGASETTVQALVRMLSLFGIVIIVSRGTH